MISSVEFVLKKEFGASLDDESIEYIDPFTGTGIFITELLQKLSPESIESIYENQISCNELSVLSYYIATLNIEYTYQQKTGRYKPFKNINCVDTFQQYENTH
jgi:predicted helicase